MDALNTAPSKRLMTVEDVAALVKWSHSKVRAEACKHNLPGFKVGREWRFWEADILEWLEDQAGRYPSTH